MENEKRQEPEALPDESLDEASGGILPYVEQDAKSSTTSITDGTSNTSVGSGFTGGVRVAVGDVNNDGAALKIADGSVKGA